MTIDFNVLAGCLIFERGTSEAMAVVASNISFMEADAPKRTALHLLANTSGEGVIEIEESLDDIVAALAELGRGREDIKKTQMRDLMKEVIAKVLAEHNAELSAQRNVAG